MAKSTFNTRQYTSEYFVESCGAVLFDLTSPQKEVCLIQDLRNNEWYLAKGRRNQGESRQSAALREIQEETGYQCHLHPVHMRTRAPPRDEEPNAPDTAQLYASLTEPFMVTIRELNDFNVKLIFWYVAALDEGSRGEAKPGEAGFKAEFVSCVDAMARLTFQTDREVLKQAIKLIEGTPTFLN
jgi:8-oxo-dGTP pyrophosphatase MutT (NUDIX family)